MDLQKIGSFLAQLRKAQGLTQEQLGEKMGVSNKTVSRWENGNYLPPVEVLQQLADYYAVSINELLSGQRLDEAQFREKAEENICVALSHQSYSFRQRLGVCGEWLQKYWWSFLLVLILGLSIFSRLSLVLDGEEKVVIMGISVCLLGLSVIGNHLIFYVSRRAYKITGKPEEFRIFRILRTLWLLLLFVMAFVIYDLFVSYLAVVTPGGNINGNFPTSRFYGILFFDDGDMILSHFNALIKTLQFTLTIILVNLDLTVLWMKK